MFNSPIHDHAFKILMSLLNVNDYYHGQVSNGLKADGRFSIGLVWNSETYRRSAQQWESINKVVGPVYSARLDGDAVEILYRPAA